MQEITITNYQFQTHKLCVNSLEPTVIIAENKCTKCAKYGTRARAAAYEIASKCTIKYNHEGNEESGTCINDMIQKVVPCKEKELQDVTED